MGRVTEFIDYLYRKPEDLSATFIHFNYTHIEITPKLKILRQSLRLYRDKNDVKK